MLSKLSDCPNTDTLLCYYNYPFLTVHMQCFFQDQIQVGCSYESQPLISLYFQSRYLLTLPSSENGPAPSNTVLPQNHVGRIMVGPNAVKAWGMVGYYTVKNGSLL